ESGRAPDLYPLLDRRRTQTRHGPIQDDQGMGHRRADPAILSFPSRARPYETVCAARALGPQIGAGLASLPNGRPHAPPPRAQRCLVLNRSLRPSVVFRVRLLSARDPRRRRSIGTYSPKHRISPVFQSVHAPFHAPSVSTPVMIAELRGISATA